MSAAALIEQLHAHGIRLVAANDGVNLRVSGKPLPPDLRQQALSHKTELLAYLAARPAANDPALHDWEATDRAYQQHVAHCPQCRSAGQGYGARCEAGAELWQAHQSAPMPIPMAYAAACHGANPVRPPLVNGIWQSSRKSAAKLLIAQLNSTLSTAHAPKLQGLPKAPRAREVFGFLGGNAPCAAKEAVLTSQLTSHGEASMVLLKIETSIF